MKGLIAAVVLIVFSVDYTIGKTTTTSTTITPSTTAIPVKELCAAASKDCETCVKNAQCLWCGSDSISVKCVPYPKSEIIPKKDVCDLNDARWGVCWVNYKILLIVMGTLAGVILISFSCCIYCCCCRKKNNRAKYAREEAQMEREREERRAKHAERRSERNSRMNEIRQKYGLGGKENTDGGYRRFDNEA